MTWIGMGEPYNMDPKRAKAGPGHLTTTPHGLIEVKPSPGAPYEQALSCQEFPALDPHKRKALFQVRATAAPLRLPLPHSPPAHIAAIRRLENLTQIWLAMESARFQELLNPKIK
jgi:hypothetical protein